ncbi:unnamed protein product [Orchesella dallaii]|uniref:Uncharacterized protein n=1 Tax=Orchesella dallaii TaxID=48710 RepID=A0ABP1PU14_9HEXA
MILKLDGYEVALKSISWSDDFKIQRTWEEESAVPIPKTGIPFFQPNSSQNEIILDKVFQEDVVFVKDFNDINSCITALTDFFEENHIPAQISMFRDPSGFLKYTTLIHNDPENFLLHFPPELSKAIGFKTSKFGNASYTSDLTINDVYIQQFPNGHEFTISRFKSERVVIKLDSTEDPTLQDLCSLIVASVFQNGAMLSLIVNEDLGTLEYDLEPITYNLRLSRFLLEHIGLPANTIIRGSGTFRVRTSAIDPYAPFQGIYLNRKQYEKTLSSGLMLVTSNCVNSTLLLNKRLYPCLGVISRKEGVNKIFSFAPEKLTYFPATDSVLSHISVKLLTEDGNALPEIERPTCVELLFRKAWF